MSADTAERAQVERIKRYLSELPDSDRWVRALFLDTIADYEAHTPPEPRVEGAEH